jgi:nucleoside-diphosphate-sugar epimerase
MRYLVTGSQGFTGRFVCAAILGADSSATLVGTGRSVERDAVFTHHISWGDRRIAAPLTAQLPPLDRERYRYARCELGDADALDFLLEQYTPDVVVHLAAALRDQPPDVLVRSNVEGTGALVRGLAKLAHKPRLVLGSSGSVYGAPASVPLTEDQRCAPNEPYAASKLAAEFVASVLANGAGIPMMTARIFNIAGPGQDERHVCGRFTAQAAAIRLGVAPPQIAVGDLRPTRDFIDVRDVADAIVALAAKGTPGEIYNVGSGTETAIGDVLAMVLRAAGLDGAVNIVESYCREADAPRAYADISKLRSCGFTPRFLLQRTLDDLFAYYVRHVSRIFGGATTSATS